MIAQRWGAGLTRCAAKSHSSHIWILKLIAHRSCVTASKARSSAAQRSAAQSIAPSVPSLLAAARLALRRGFRQQVLNVNTEEPRARGRSCSARPGLRWLAVHLGHLGHLASCCSSLAQLSIVNCQLGSSSTVKSSLASCCSSPCHATSRTSNQIAAAVRQVNDE